MTSCSSLISYWILIKFSSLNLIRKSWVLVSGMGYMNWGIVLVSDVGGLQIADCKLGWEAEGFWEVVRIEV